MTFWTFLILFFILSLFMIAQFVKLLNSDTRAGEAARAFAWSIINRIRRRAESDGPSADDD